MDSKTNHSKFTYKFIREIDKDAFLT